MVDGTHIPIIAPEEFAKDYYNRKGYYSVLMQGLVDSSYCFTDIYIGWPGSVHDARMFCSSNVYKWGENGTLLPNSDKLIHNVKVPLIILGDPAYPLLHWVMKPFTDNGKLSVDQVNFNYHLSRARIVVENTFGRMKGRWRCLLKRNDMHITNIPTVIAVCAILHNMCEMHNDEFDESWLPESTNSIDDYCNTTTNNNATTSNDSAECIRNVM